MEINDMIKKATPAIESKLSLYCSILTMSPVSALSVSRGRL